MKRSDFVSILIIGVIVAIFLIFILKSLGLDEGVAFYLRISIWWLVLLLPILALIALYITYFIGKRIPAIFQFGKFVSVGFANTAVDYGILNLMMLLTGITSGVFYSVFKGVSFIFAASNSYLWNKFWTFKATEKKGVAKESLQFLTVTIIGSIINITVASLVVNLITPMWGLSPTLWANAGAVAGTVVGLMWNFFGYKFIVFKK